MASPHCKIFLIESLKHGADGKPELGVINVSKSQSLPIGIVLVPSGKLKPTESGSGYRVINVPLLIHPAIYENMGDGPHTLIRLASSLAEYRPSPDQDVFEE